MEDLVSSFKQYIGSHHLFQPKDHLLLAVSGGVDSVVLCELCFQSGYSFSIAHCNFKLRGTESDGDEIFVKELAKKYQVEFHVIQFDTATYASDNKTSIQVAARELRYNWFSKLKSQSAFPMFLLTAHHADDNIETILMNFFKGSGINGLKGILPKQNGIVRPLLFAGKEAIHLFAKQNNLDYREDSSNSSDKYTRNYFRNELIPGIEKVFPQVKDNMLRNADRFREINSIYQSAVEKITAALVFKQGDEYHIPVLKLQKTEAMPSIVFEIIKDYGFTSHQTEEVIKLLQSETGKYVQSPTHRILRNRKWLIISALQQEEDSIQLIESANSCIYYRHGKLMIDKTSTLSAIIEDPGVAQLDAGELSFPLLVRKWKTGDYFYPLGMPKKKKVGRFLSDLKLSANQKQNVWVIESDKKIIWVIGYRIDHRFRIKNSTKEIITITLH
ncbi:MAG: tRNA lysidine(34) synthetase TilS [Chitinophagaceae bacterium]|nr:MAG: tRNA lysidine(34) synthetase TilS [Chitinophagaceae bacterium]